MENAAGTCIAEDVLVPLEIDPFYADMSPASLSPFDDLRQPGGERVQDPIQEGPRFSFFSSHVGLRNGPVTEPSCLLHVSFA